MPCESKFPCRVVVRWVLVGLMFIVGHYLEYINLGVFLHVLNRLRVALHRGASCHEEDDEMGTPASIRLAGAPIWGAFLMGYRLPSASVVAWRKLFTHSEVFASSAFL